MSAEIALANRGRQNQAASLSVERMRTAAWRIAMATLSLTLLLAAWLVRYQEPYSSNSDFAYYLGLVGGSLMLGLLLYPLRKRVRILQSFGPLRFWFRFHMIGGLLGPLLVLFHSTFQVRSLNAAVALGSMLLVAASGIVGRFIYRRIHRGLYGSRTSQEELQQSLEKQLQTVQSSPILPDEVKQEIERFARLVSFVPANRWQRFLHFVSLGFRRHLAGKRTRLTMARHAESARTVMHGTLANLDELLLNIDATLRAVQTTAQFSTYERLFSLWHTVHIPFLFMLLLTAVVHVVAVHAY